MSTSNSTVETAVNNEITPVYVPDAEERIARNEVLTDYLTARTVSNKSYPQFNGRTLFECIDDWTKRWNGYVPPASVLIDRDQSRIFLNFTRNQIVSYLAKVALARVKAKIKAVNKKTGMMDEKMAEVFSDLNEYSLNEENGDARFMEAALECTTKGTVITYEGYRRQIEEMDVPEDFDAETGKIKTKKQERVVFDNCFQKVVPLEDFYVANPYEPDVQKQPFVIWREITTYEEARATYGHYDNWKYVVKGSYGMASDPTTFYRSKVLSDLNADQVEILREYKRGKKPKHRVVINGVVLYSGPIPFKDGKYPFAKGIFEPYEVAFFWGMGFPDKIMGEQDLQNTFINMMADKTFGSLLPYGMSSDLDDLIEDDILQPNKIRKVGDISKWKFDTLPGISAGEQGMFQLIMNLARENSGDMTGAANAFTPKGGKITARQAMLQQQEAMQRLGFSMNYLEDFERDRTELRLHHILQFFSIPKIEKITGRGGKEVEQLVYRDVRLDNVELSDGRKGSKVIKLVGDNVNNPNKRQQIADQLSVTEIMGEENGTPTEALAVSIDTFYDYNFSVQVIKNSSYQKNQVLDQAVRHEYANFLISMIPVGMQFNWPEVVKYVSESYDVDSDRFDAPPQPPGDGGGSKVSESMNFKDLPIEGQIQMAAQAGIKLGGGQPGAPQGASPSPEPTQGPSPAQQMASGKTKISPVPSMGAML